MSARLTDKHTILPPSDLDEMLDLSAFLGGLTQPAALLGPDGQTVPIPLEAFDVLRDVVEAMRVGKAITVAPVDQTLTTQEAANFLGISRPTVVKLLDEGQLAHERTSGGRHRRVRLQDLVDYQERQRVTTKSALDDLTREAAASGLYDTTAVDYAEALHAARHRTTRS